MKTNKHFHNTECDNQKEGRQEKRCRRARIWCLFVQCGRDRLRHPKTGLWRGVDQWHGKIRRRPDGCQLFSVNFC